MSKIKNTECKQLLNHIKKIGSISSKEALEKCGIIRLSKRIEDLKKRGYLIKEWCDTAINSNGKVVRFKRYALVSEEELKC